MWRHVFRPAAAVFSALLVASAPALAGTLRFADVAYSGGPSRTAWEVRLRAGGPASGQDPQTQGQAAPASPAQQPSGPSGTQPGPAVSNPADGTLTQSGGGQVETVDLGDVTGTVCDCGEIPPLFEAPKGGFPWWPLLGGAIIPFLFDGKKTTVTVTPTPTPDDTPPPAIPEPTTLLLFGTGLLALGARARRRYANRQAIVQTTNTAGEV